MVNVGHATISVLPDLSGFSRKLSRGVRSAVGVGGLGAAFGVGAFIKDSVQLEATYGRTMAQMRSATGSTGKEMRSLDKLAIDLGKATVFSANEASSAMLELAKNGISPAVIQAGALKSALTLAAAGGVDLTTAATTMGNAINAFQLRGKNAASVAAALAGAANASSASVASLAQGLQQSSASANDAGLSVQETTAILAAFANAGIAGSDAGTSLKTMLTRLVPSTVKAKDAMKKYGLAFTNANGEFLSATEIAEELKDGLGDLSAAERSAALNTIFGSDARRAATILTREGAAGLEKYIRATSDQGAAERMAQANMKGTAGALERLSGSWETVRLQFGKAIAPTVRKFLDFLATKLDDVSPKLTQFGRWFNREGAPALEEFATELKPLTGELLPAAATVLGQMRDAGKAALPHIKGIVRAFNNMPGWAQKAIVAGGATAVVGGKLGLGSLLKGGAKTATGGGIFARGSSPARPLYVFTVNGGGGPKVPAIVPKVGSLPKWAPFIPVGLGSAPGQDSPLKQLTGIGMGADKSNQLELPKKVAGNWDKARGAASDYFVALQNEGTPAWDKVRARAADYFTLLQQHKHTELTTTVTGWDLANRQAREQYEWILRIRALHNEDRLDRAGGSGSRPGSGINPRGVNFSGPITVVAPDPKAFISHMQRRNIAAAANGMPPS